MTSMKILMIDVHLGPLGVAASFHLEVMHSSCSSPRKEAVSKVKKKCAILKRAVTERRERLPQKEWYNKTKSLAATCWWRRWTKLA